MRLIASGGKGTETNCDDNFQFAASWCSGICRSG